LSRDHASDGQGSLEKIEEHVVRNPEIYHRQFCPLYWHRGILQDREWYLSRSVIRNVTNRATNSLFTSQQKTHPITKSQWSSLSTHPGPKLRHRRYKVNLGRREGSWSAATPTSDKASWTSPAESTTPSSLRKPWRDQPKSGLWTVTCVMWVSLVLEQTKARTIVRE